MALVIAGDALGARVERGFPIDKKAVVVVTVGQRNLHQPCAIRLPFHGV